MNTRIINKNEKQKHPHYRNSSKYLENRKNGKHRYRYA